MVSITILRQSKRRKMTENKMIINSVTTHFHFLLEAGYKIEFLEKTGVMGGWNLKLTSKELALRLISDRGEWFLAISPLQEECWIGLGVAVFLITDEMELVPSCDKEILRDDDKQLFRLAQILEKYFSDIKMVFGSDFYAHKDKLMALRKKVRDLQLKSFIAKKQ
jgi:hypothetical protein